jgi:hypothetical protein
MNYFGLFIVNKLLSVCFIILENELAYPAVFNAALISSPIAYYGSNSVKTFVPFAGCGVNTGPYRKKTIKKFVILYTFY